MPELTLLDAIHQALDEELARDERVILLGQDIGARGGVFRATQGLLEKYGEKRVIDSPLAEASLVGVAIGAALAGQHPICEIQFAEALYTAFNQIVNEAARMSYRSGGEWSVPLVIRAPYGGGLSGGLYHSQSVEAFFAHVPGLKVVIPSSPLEAKGLLKSAVRDAGPVLFLEPKKGYRTLKDEVPNGDSAGITIPIGPARISRAGQQISVFAYGLIHHYCLQAAEALAHENIDAEVVDLRTLAPMDKATILASVRKTGRALVVYEDNLTLGYGAEVAAHIAQEAFSDLDAPIHRLAAPDVPAMPFGQTEQDWFMLNPEKIAAAIRALANY
jgi:2-oxoisovalerate dehydrogenase E1 component subunit beta